MLPPKVKGAVTHIVMASNNAHERRLFKLAIKQLTISCNLSVIKNGALFLNLLSRADFTPDMIFCDKDILLVNTDFIHLIKQNIKYRSIPVVIFSTSPNSRSKDYCYDTPANEYFLRALSFLV